MNACIAAEIKMPLPSPVICFINYSRVFPKDCATYSPMKQYHVCLCIIMTTLKCFAVFLCLWYQFLHIRVNHMPISEGVVPVSLFTKRTVVLPQDLVKPRGREIGCYNDRIALHFDRQLDSDAAEVPVKFQSDWKLLSPNLGASRFREILRYDVRTLSE